MGDDLRIDTHWRKPPDDDLAAWIRELRSRSHDQANWCSRVEGLLRQVASADEIATLVHTRLKRSVFGWFGRGTKALLAAVAILQVVTLVRAIG